MKTTQNYYRICVCILLISNLLLIWKNKGGVDGERIEEDVSVLMPLCLSDLLRNDGLYLDDLLLEDIASREFTPMECYSVTAPRESWYAGLISSIVRMY